mgnify:FL=1
MRSALALFAVLLAGCSCGQWDPQDDLDLTDLPHPCDEYNATINPDLADGEPGADEVCNGRDDDCDGLVDADDPDLVTTSTYWADADGDGFGDSLSPIVACGPADGIADQDGDCDDAASTTYPGAEEQWYDGVDSDCDGNENPDPCEETPPQAPSVVDSDCEVVAQFQLEVLSSGLDTNGGGSSLSTPLVGQLTDDDGNGIVNDGDTPDIVAVSNDTGGYAVRIAPGDGSAPPTQIFELITPAGSAVPTSMGQLAIGDVNVDGDPDLVGIFDVSGDCHPVAFEPDGTFLWIQTGVVLGCLHEAPALADLDGDGAVEVLVSNHILRGVDGSIRGTGALGTGSSAEYINSGGHPIPADLDGVAPLEVVVGNAVYSPDGATICATGDADGYPAVADLDGDGLGEIVVTGTNDVRLYEHDCAPIRSWALGDGGPGGPATIADLDGDGDPEIAVSSNSFVYAFEVDGSTMWSGTVQDFSSGAAALASFDFDGDGASEVVSSDELQLSIFDGPSGSLLFRDEVRVSGTRNEFAVIADVDGDGQAEIVAPSEGPAAWYVFGESNGWWPSAPARWTQDAFVPSWSTATGALPSDASAPWPTENAFRWTPATGGGAPDLVPAADLELLAEGLCDAFGGAVQFWLQIRNRGGEDAEVDVAVVIEGIDAAGTRSPISQLFFPGPIPSGGVTDVFQSALVPLQIEGFTSIAFRAVESTFGEPTLRECRTDNNEVVIPLPTGG